MEVDWTLPVLLAADCAPCECCGEPWCAECGEHYADCAHPGPHSELEVVDEAGTFYQRDVEHIYGVLNEK